MGSEIAVPVLGPIVLFAAVFLVFMAIRDRRRPVSVSSTLGLGRSRIALGYLGLLVALIPVAIWMARDDARFQIEHHYISAQDAALYQPGWALTFYFILTPIAIFLTTVVGLPLLALLRKIGFASVAGTLSAGVVVAVILSFWFDKVSAANIAMFETVTAGFVLGARLPVIRSPTLVSKALSEQKRSAGPP